MCFAASVSFLMGSVLGVVGVASATMAYRSNKKWIAFALIPLMSGIQQIIEGIVWVQLNNGNSLGAHFYSYFYLFFAYALWPSYVPICVYLLEPEQRRKKLFQLFVIAGFIISAAFFIPLLTGIVTVTTLIENRSIHYLTNVSYLTIWTYSICYAGTVILPLLLSTIRRVKIFGMLMLLALLLTYWLYITVFTSVWCFFAAIGSVYILLIMYKLRTSQ